MPCSIVVFAIVLLLLERIRPGSRLHKVRTWTLRLLLINTAQTGVMLLILLFSDGWAPRSVFRLSHHVGPVPAALIAYFIGTFVFYWWHRWRHENDFLWRVFHQVHHSPQRLESLMTFYKHPAEMVADCSIGCLLVFPLLGLSVQAAGIYTVLTAAGEIFFHANLKTPRWIGYFFQRPEMHRVHHQVHRHRNNYGDIVIWDWLFGTYENPRQWTGECGFDGDKEQQLLAMLACRDLHQESGRGHFGAPAAVSFPPEPVSSPGA